MRFGKFVGSFKVGVFVAVVAVALAGCAEPTPTAKLPGRPSSSASSATDSSAAPTSAAPVTSAAPTTTYTLEEQAVIDQYRGFYEAFYGMPNFDEASIRSAFSKYASPAYIDQLVTAFMTNIAAKGAHPAGSVQFGPISLSFEGEFAYVTECRDGSTELLVSDADGSVVGQGKPNTSYSTRLRLDAAAGWLVSKSESNANAC